MTSDPDIARPSIFSYIRSAFLETHNSGTSRFHDLPDPCRSNIYHGIKIMLLERCTRSIPTVQDLGRRRVENDRRLSVDHKYLSALFDASYLTFEH